MSKFYPAFGRIVCVLVLLLAVKTKSQETSTVATPAPNPTPNFAAFEDEGSVSGEEPTPTHAPEPTPPFEGSGTTDETTDATTTDATTTFETTSADATTDFEGSGITTQESSNGTTEATTQATVPTENTTLEAVKTTITITGSTNTTAQSTSATPSYEPENVVQINITIATASTDLVQFEKDAETALSLAYNGNQTTATRRRKRSTNVLYKVTVLNFTSTTNPSVPVLINYIVSTGSDLITGDRAANILNQKGINAIIASMNGFATDATSPAAVQSVDENLIVLLSLFTPDNFVENGMMVCHRGKATSAIYPSCADVNEGIDSATTHNALNEGIRVAVFNPSVHPARRENGPGTIRITDIANIDNKTLTIAFYANNNLRDLLASEVVGKLSGRILEILSIDLGRVAAASPIALVDNTTPASNATAQGTTMNATTTDLATTDLATTDLATTAVALAVVTPIWAIIVIAILGFIILVLLAIIVWLCCFKMKDKKTEAAQVVPAASQTVITTKYEEKMSPRIEQAPPPPEPTKPQKVTHVRKRVAKPEPKPVEQRPRSSSGVSEQSSTGDSAEQDLFLRVSETRPRKSLPIHEHSGRLTQEPKFRSSVHPISLPPIYSPKMSDRLHDSLTDDAITERSHRSSRHSPSGYNEPQLRAYRAMQHPIDQILEPSEPEVFQSRPPRKRFHKRHGTMHTDRPGDVEMQLLTSPTSQPPGTYTTINPYSQNHQDPKESFDEIRNRMASLLEDAFSLINPNASRNLISPQHPPLTYVQPQTTSFQRQEPLPILQPPMPTADGRDSNIPRMPAATPIPNHSTDDQNHVVFTKTHPRIVPDQHKAPKHSTPSSMTGPTASGKPVYITPIKRVPDNTVDQNVVWTPYRAFDEISRLEKSGEIAPPENQTTLLPGRMGSFNSPNTNTVHNVTSSPPHNPPPRIAPSSNQIPPDKEATDNLVQSIKDEIARLAGLPTPVQEFQS